jgi:hypothetical protein
MPAGGARRSRWAGGRGLAALAVAGLGLLGVTVGTASPAAAATSDTPATSATSAASPEAPGEQPASVTVPDAAADPLLGTDPEAAADAEPSPAPSPAPPPTPSATPSTAPPAGVISANPDGQVSYDEASRLIDEIAAEAGEPTPDMLRSLLGSTVGDHPWGSYELGASVGGLEHLLSAWARIVFEVGKQIVLFATWVLEFVLDFDLGRYLARVVGAIAEANVLRLEDPAGPLPATVPLRALAATAAVAHAGWQVLRHRGHAAMSELLVGALIAAVGGYVLTNAGSAACTGLSVMGELTTGTFALADPDAEIPAARGDWCGDGVAVAGPAAGGSPAADVVADVFVHEPYLLLQWGVVPEAGTSCRRVADALVAARGWGNADFPRGQMDAAGCTAMATFNEDLTAPRVAGAAAYAAGATAFAVAVLLTAGTLLVAQVAGAVLVLAMPFALVIGIAPGAGRDLLARWVHGVLKVAVLFLGSGFVLAVLLTAVSAVQTMTANDGVLVRMLGSTGVAWSLVLLRGRVMGQGRHLAHGVARRATGGRDVGAVGRGPGQAAVAGTYAVADLAATVHGGVVAGAAAIRGVRRLTGGSMRSAGVQRGLAARHRATATLGEPAVAADAASQRRHRPPGPPPDVQAVATLLPARPPAPGPPRTRAATAVDPPAAGPRRTAPDAGAIAGGGRDRGGADGAPEEVSSSADPGPAVHRPTTPSSPPRRPAAPAPVDPDAGGST